MAIPSGTFQRFSAIGVKEDLSDVVYMISPEKTPFLSMAKRAKAINTLHEWQTDELASASANNYVAEGADAVVNTATPTVRYGNYTQISAKTVQVSDTMRAVNTAGRADELSYQTRVKRMAELKRDMESRLLAATAGSAGTVGTTTGYRKCAGVGRWLWNNVQKKGTAATTPAVSSGVPTAAITPGTAAAFTETDLQTLLQAIWEDGGEPGTILVGGFNKRKASAFGGIATLYKDAPGTDQATIIGAADLYVSDWGQHRIIADHFMPTNNVYALDMSKWAVAYLRPMKVKDLGATGDSSKQQLTVEYTLEACNPASSGKVYTTTTS